MNGKHGWAGLGQIIIVTLFTANLLATGILGIYTLSHDNNRNYGMEDAADGSYSAMEKYTLYIGLNDKDAYEQIISTEEGVRRVNEICARYVEGYSMQRAEGGWVDEKEILTEENTLVYSFYGVTREQVTQIMDDVLKELNQSSILVTYGHENSAYYYGGGGSDD